METLNEENWMRSGWHPADDVLLMILDGELPEKELALGRSHLDACWSCRARSEELQSTISSFVKYNDSVLNPLIDREPRGWGGFKARLNNAVLELGKPLPWYRNLLAGTGRFGLFRLIESLRLGVGGLGRRRAAFASAFLALLLIGLLAWLATSPGDGVSASEILSEGELRTAIWQNQPGKVLNWGRETTQQNHQGGLPDGKSRSLTWQNNVGGKSLLVRTYDENGVLVWASWVRADGSQVTYQRFPEEIIRIYPTRDALRVYAAGLDVESRQVLKKYIESPIKSSQINSQPNNQIKIQSLNRWASRGSVQTIQTADAGKIFRIQYAIEPSGVEKFTRGEVEIEIAADSFMRRRIKSVRYYPDGKVAIEDSRLEFYRETSVEDFDTHDLTKEMREVKRVVKVMPEEVLKTAQRGETKK